MRAINGLPEMKTHGEKKARQMVFIGYVCIADLVVISDYRIRIMYRWLLFIEKDN